MPDDPQNAELSVSIASEDAIGAGLDAANSGAIMRAMLTPDMAVTMAFHNAIGRPVGVSAEEVWTAMITAAIGEPFAEDDD